MVSASNPSSWTRPSAAETSLARLRPCDFSGSSLVILLAILTPLGIICPHNNPNNVSDKEIESMQATQGRWRFKGPEMEGAVARWYAGLRGSESQIEQYRRQ